jgi:hypothetical protein
LRLENISARNQVYGGLIFVSSFLIAMEPMSIAMVAVEMVMVANESRGLNRLQQGEIVTVELFDEHQHQHQQQNRICCRTEISLVIHVWENHEASYEASHEATESDEQVYLQQ